MHKFIPESIRSNFETNSKVRKLTQKMRPDPKWRGSVSAKVNHATADYIWSLYKDFFNFHTWFPTLTACSGVSGANGEIGCVRYCAGSSLPNNGAPSVGHAVSWSKERLVAVDEEKRSLKYEIVDSNIGFEDYAASVNVIDGLGFVVVEWRFEVSPVGGLNFEELVTKYEKGLVETLKNMEKDYIAQQAAFA